MQFRYFSGPIAPLLLLMLMLLSIPVANASKVYTWTDKNGITHFSTEKPTGVHSETVQVNSGKSSPAADKRFQRQQAQKNQSWVNSALKKKPIKSSQTNNGRNCNRIIKEINKAIDKEMKELLSGYRQYQVPQKEYRSKKHNLINIKRSLSYNQCLSGKVSIYSCMDRFADIDYCADY